jgi:hypothetical protein
MTLKGLCAVSITVVCLLAVSVINAQDNRIRRNMDTWSEAKGGAPGTDMNAQDEAVKVALRKCVEETCGTFLTSESKTKDYKAVYDKVFADTVGYVVEHKVVRVWVEDGNTWALVRARVSTERFEADWAKIKHTLNQEDNPRVIIAIAETTRWAATAPVFDVEEAGNVQSTIEDYFLDKGVILVDRETASKVSKRDLLLASVKDDTAEIAAIGARFKADVVIVGKATAKYGGEFNMDIGDTRQELHKYTGTLSVRAIRTDSSQLLVSKSFSTTINATESQGGEDKALTKLAKEAAPKLLQATVEAWRKQVNVSRNIQLNISGMDYAGWKKFKEEAEKIRGMQALRLREITEAVANIDVEYEFSKENLADRLTEMKSVKLEIVEISPNRIKLKMETP